MCKKEITNLLHIEKCLIVNNPKMDKIKERKVYSDDAEDIWLKIEDQYKVMSGHRDEALDKYYTEAQLISGNIKNNVKDNMSMKGISNQVNELFFKLNLNF